MTDLSKFDVSYDPQARLLRWTMRGFWSMADVLAFGALLRKVVEPLGPPPHRFDSLADSRDFPVQSSEVSRALGEIDRIGAAMQVGRTAVVVGSMINKMQAQRTLRQGEVKVFMSLEDATTWLSEARDTDHG